MTSWTNRKSRILGKQRPSARARGRNLRFETLEDRALLAVTIEVGDHVLLPDTAGQWIEIRVDSSDPDTDPEVTGLNLRAQLGDGAGGLSEPRFQAIDFGGGIWDAFPYTVMGGPVQDSYLFASVAFNETGQQVAASGRLVRVQVSTVGITQGEYPLRLQHIPAIGDDTHFVLTGPVRYDPELLDGRIVVLGPQVVGRHVFYNNSAWDGNDAGLNDDDYQAIAPPPPVSGQGHAAGMDQPDRELGKTALLPGQLASFVNYTSYDKGLNGIIVAFDRLADPEAVTAADFEFHVGHDNSPSGWEIAPAPSGFRVDRGVALPPFADSPDVVTITWEDGAISNQWLQVTVLANSRTGLATADVFYFGNAVGETGDVPGDTLVDGYDVAAVAANPRGLDDPATITDPYDFDRDGLVDETDQTLAAVHSTDPDTCLWLLDLRQPALPQVSVSVSPTIVSETGPDPLVYTFTRSGATDDPVTATFRVTGTAMYPDDYTVSGAASFSEQLGMVHFAAGSATAQVLVDPVEDGMPEGAETVWLLVLPGEDFAVGSPSSAVGRITDDPIGRTRIDMTIVSEPSTIDDKGEVERLFDSADWVHEWQSFWIEIWVSTPDATSLLKKGTGTTTNSGLVHGQVPPVVEPVPFFSNNTALGIASASVDLVYDTNLLTAIAIQHGPAFAQQGTGTIDDEGLVRSVGGTADRDDVGDDAYVLLARVRFASTGDDQVPVVAEDGFLGPYDMAMALQNGQTELVGGFAPLTDLGESPDTQLWAVMYDFGSVVANVEENNGIDFGDLSYFAAAFGKFVGPSHPPYTAWADFDRSGRIDFGDLAFFAPNFGKTRAGVQSGAQTLVFPPNFPDAWRTGSGTSEGEEQLAGGEGEASVGGPMMKAASDGSQRATGLPWQWAWAVDEAHTALQAKASHDLSRGTTAGREAKLALPLRRESLVPLYSRSDKPVVPSAESPDRQFEDWPPLEDLLPSSAEAPTGRLSDHWLDPHEALFTQIGR